MIVVLGAKPLPAPDAHDGQGDSGVERDGVLDAEAVEVTWVDLPPAAHRRNDLLGAHANRGACTGRGASAPVVDQWQWLAWLTTRAKSSRSTLRSVVHVVPNCDS